MKQLFIACMLISLFLSLSFCGKRNNSEEVLSSINVDVYTYAISNGIAPLNDSLIFGIFLNPNECVNCYIVFNILKKDLGIMQDSFAFNTAFFFPDMRKIERDVFRNKELGLKDFSGARYFYSDSLYSFLNQGINTGFTLQYPKSSGIFILDKENRVIFYQDFKRLVVQDLYEELIKLRQPDKPIQDSL